MSAQNKFHKITIEDLAIMVAKGFTEMDRQFKEVNKRLDRIEARLDSIEKKVYHDHEHRIRRIEENLEIA